MGILEFPRYSGPKTNRKIIPFKSLWNLLHVWHHILSPKDYRHCIIGSEDIESTDFPSSDMHSKCMDSARDAPEMIPQYHPSGSGMLQYAT